MADLEDFKIPIDANFSDIIVPTVDTIRSTFVLELLLGTQKTVSDLVSSIGLHDVVVINVWIVIVDNGLVRASDSQSIGREFDCRPFCGAKVKK